MRTVARVAVLTMLISLMQALPALAAPPPFAGADLERFIVVLEDDVEPRGFALNAQSEVGGELGFLYENAIKGFTIEMPAAAINGLRNLPGVRLVEPDIEVTVAAQTESTGWDRIDAELNPGGADYSSIGIAVLDTGIWYDPALSKSHEDLNLKWVTDCTGAILYPTFGGCSGGGNDANGHGTHVAGIAAACDNDIGTRGVAPCATLWSFKVIGDGGTGYLGSILAGVDLVAANADQIDVANMSLTFAGESQALEDAINAATAQGVVFVVAAGNDSADANGYMPAAVGAAITVSSIDDFDGDAGGTGIPSCRPGADDQLAAYSNYGSVIDIAAPGTCILSAGINNTYTTKSGTSMASPTVAGAAARYIGDNGLDLTNAAGVQSVRDALVNGGMPQTGPCGFGGDTDNFNEPLLFMNGSAFGGDGTCDAGDPPPSDPPVAVIDTPTCTDLDCDFVGSNSTDDTGIDTYDWDFGDGNTATGETASHSYGVEGSYDVTLTVTDLDGQTATATVTVDPTAPNQPPTAVISSASCTYLDCTFDSAGSSDDGGIVSFAWTFGDGGTSALPAPNYSYAAAGTYVVSLTVTDGEGLTDTTSVPASPTDPPPPNEAPTAVISSASCTFLDCDFDSLGSSDDTGIVSYSWTFGDGGTSNAPAPSHLYGAGGSYNVTLTVEDGEGLSDSTSVTVNPTDPPPPNEAPTAVISIASCTDLVCNFDSFGSSDDTMIVSYAWTFGDGGSSSAQAPTHTYASPGGTFDVTLTVEDAEGLTDSTSVSVSPSDPPPPNEAPTAVITTASCTDLDCTFDGSDSTDDSGISSYAWDFGDGNTASGATALHTYAAAGSYIVTLTVEDAEGEQGTTTTTVNPTDPPPPPNEAPTAVISMASCTDLACNFDSVGSGDDVLIVSYSWDFGDSTPAASGSSASHTYASPGGTFTVTLTVADAEGLTDTATVQVNPAPQNQPPSAVITTASCTDLDCSFSGSGSTDDDGISSYAWNFGDGNTGSGVAASHSYAVAGTYTVTLTVTDTDGETDSTSTSVTAEEPAGPPAITVVSLDVVDDGLYAVATFKLIDPDGAPVVGAEVVAEWTFIDGRGRIRNRNALGTSDEEGDVYIRTRFRRKTPTLFCVESVTIAGYVYVGGSDCIAPRAI